MVEARYEEYGRYTDLPFILHTGIERTRFNCSKEKNWHEDLELELCTEGSGTVLLNGEKLLFEVGNIVAIGSNVMHYTGTEGSLKYTCLIINAEFCKQLNIGYEKLSFQPLINDSELAELIKELSRLYGDESEAFRTPKLYGLLIKIIIILVEKYAAVINGEKESVKDFKRVKAAISYIRKNYGKKLSLDEIANAIYADKYTLCREFKISTGQTVVEYINKYRVQKATDCLKEGCTVSEAAEKCGFTNLSFFAKTFRKYTGSLPSSFKL